jgi:hypothetical protein
MSTRTRKPGALAAGFLFLGFAVSGCELAGPIGPSALPAAIAARNAADDTRDPVRAPRAAVPTLDQDSSPELSPNCLVLNSVPERQRWATRGPGGKPVCR